MSQKENSRKIGTTTISNRYETKNYKNSTTLRTYLWSIKSEKQNANLSWETMRQAAPYSDIAKQCLLCLHEKSAIASYTNPKSY